jgi:hypothetical protein
VDNSKTHPEPPIAPVEAGRRLGLRNVIESEENLKIVVLRMARRGDIRSVRVSKFTLIDPVSVEKYLTGR